MTLIGNDKDYLTTQVSYKLNLKGPSMADADVVLDLAGRRVCRVPEPVELRAATWRWPAASRSGCRRRRAISIRPGGILSPDGHCRTFDAEGQGTVVGNGVGIVLLKRLSDAIADGDTIHAVIKGAALNNDGSLKVGYTAPSVTGQAQVIAMAQAMAGVDPETISYVEAHGTATLLGDPIEVAALTQAFSARDQQEGLLRARIGEEQRRAPGLGGRRDGSDQDRAGARERAASRRASTSRRRIRRSTSPAARSTSTTSCAVGDATAAPRRAGVSSFGVGGTNAHVVLEEAPALEAFGARPGRISCSRCRRDPPSALENATANLASHLKAHPELNLADVSYTQAGRRAFAHRRVLVTRGADIAGRGSRARDARSAAA